MMTRTKGVIAPAERDKNEMFIGWSKAPAVDRRFLLAAMPVGLAATTGASALIASELDDPGAGAWLTGETIDMTGALLRAPYPMLRVPDPAAPGGARTVLIVAQGKCTSALELDGLDAKPVTASGYLIQRKERRMLEVPPLLENWLAPADLAVTPALSAPQAEPVGRIDVEGSIMDSKCFFGVMRPARGKTHKACAALCIRGGIPPSFWVRDGRGRESVLLMTTANGGPMPMDILPLVADPVRVAGNVVRVGDILQLRANPDAYQRL